MNAGYTQEEIDLLKEECKELDQSFVLIDDEPEEEADYVQFQFVGKHDGQEVIYDAVLSTLSMHHSSRLYEEAEKKIVKIYKDFVPYELRDENSPVNEEAELMMEELIQEMEDEETIKVSEFVEIDTDFDFGIGIDAALNVEEITVEVIEKFISDFNNGTLQLDKTLYSFKDGFED
ncbi:MAG: hypothetical protein KF870_16140 [Leadbetterella sp.]|nr:hypothetical protein [Leadbetterella sp.]